VELENIKIRAGEKCYHCGEACPDNPILRDDKPFCCTGCRIVYELLDENNLCTYYDLDEHPGIRLDKLVQSDQFAILDDDEVVERLIDFRDDSITQITLSIPAIHCKSCVWLLENLNQLIDGVLESRVQFMRKELSLSFSHEETSLRTIAEVLAQTGYEPSLQLKSLDGDSPNTHPNRRLWLQVGVAGFAFGNIMLMSFPEYLTGMAIDATMQTVFGVLNIALALPVLLFSAADYLKSAWNALTNRGINLDVPIALGMTALFGRSFYEIVTRTGPGYLDTFAGFIFLLLIGKMLQKKTFEHLNFDRNYRSYFPISVLRRKEGTEQTVSVEKVEPGDILRIRNHEVIPVDAELLSSNTHIDYSFVTGESDPVTANEGDHLYAGGRIAGPAVRVRATKRVNNSRLTELWNRKEGQNQPTDAHMTELVDRISPYFTFTVIAIAFAAAGYWMVVDAGLAANVFTAVLIVACPCALALSSPFTFGNALNVLSNNGLFVKSTSALERLANIDTIVFDKTGTLTHHEKLDMKYEGVTLSTEEQSVFRQLFENSLHPLSRSIIKRFDTFIRMAASNGKQDLSNSKEIAPIKSVEEHAGKGVSAKYQNTIFAAGSRQFLQELGMKPVEQLPENNSKGSTVYLGRGRTIIGRVNLIQPYRKGTKSIISRLKKIFNLFLLTGDNKDQKPVLKEIFGNTSLLHFRQTPAQKLDFIEALKEKSQHILMIGDGLNDAGAIRASHFGISLTEQISSFSPACDAIMEADLFSKLDRVIAFGKGCKKIIWFSFGLSLLYNIAGLAFAITGKLTPLVAAILMPLSSISIMAFTTLTTRMLAKNKGLKLWK